jgi:hypothetical protein
MLVLAVNALNLSPKCLLLHSSEFQGAKLQESLKQSFEVVALPVFWWQLHL